MSQRKLPRCVRKLNVAYQIIMVLLGISNGVFGAVESHGFDVPKMYYVIFSIGASFLPVVWSKILDSLKQYHNDLTPPDTSPEIPHAIEIVAPIPTTPSEDPHQSECDA